MVFFLDIFLHFGNLEMEDFPWNTYEKIWDFPGEMEEYINGITRNGKARLRAHTLGPLDFRRRSFSRGK
jgi:hypothetical protein